MTSSTTSHLVGSTDLKLGQSNADKSNVKCHSRNDAAGLGDACPSSDQPQREREHPSARQDSTSLRWGPEVEASASGDQPAKPSFGIGFTCNEDTGAVYPVIISVALIDSCWIEFKVLRLTNDDVVVSEVWIRLKRVLDAEGDIFVSGSVSATCDEWAKVQQDDVEALLNLTEALTERFEGSGISEYQLYVLPEDRLPAFVAKRLAEGSEQ